MIRASLMVLLATGATALLPLSPLEAQRLTLSDLAAGARVRVAAPGLGPSVTGTLLSRSDDAINVQPSRAPIAGADTMWIPIASVSRLHVLDGQRRQPGRRAAVGALIGFTVGGVLGFLTLDDSFANEDSGSNGFGTAVGAVFGGGIGALTGFAIGLKPSDYWRRVDLPGR